MNKLFKKSVTIFAVTAVISILMPTVVFADSLKCDMLNDPAQTKDWIISILEEEIGGPTSTADVSTIILCFRETKPETVNGKEVQTSKYVDICSPSATISCQRVQVILAKSGAALLYSYIGLIYKWAAGVIGVISVLYMVWGGIQISAAGDNAGKIDEAKQKILQSIAGLILLFMSAVILYTINPNFFTA